VPPTALSRVLVELRATRFAALAGARVSATIPIAEALVNDLVAASLPADAQVRAVRVEPRPSNRLRVSARLTRAEFLPPISLTLEIEQQPVLPHSPLVLRVLSLPALMSLAGAALSSSARLPPGITIHGQRVEVDIAMLLERAGLGEVVPCVESLQVTTTPGVLVLEVRLGIKEGG
jgi:hypothetical protein